MPGRWYRKLVFFALTGWLGGHTWPLGSTHALAATDVRVDVRFEVRAVPGRFTVSLLPPAGRDGRTRGRLKSSDCSDADADSDAGAGVAGSLGDVVRRVERGAGSGSGSG